MNQCENVNCIYYFQNYCTLPNIDVNEIGLCMDAILVSFSEEELAPKRKAILDLYAREEALWEEQDRKNKK